MRSLILPSVVIMLLVAALTACHSNEQGRAANTASTTDTAANKPASTANNPATPVAQTTQTDGVRRITPAELHDALDKGAAVVIDVRSEDTYKAGHIKGARSIPVNDFLSRVDELPRDKMIVTYCS